MVDDTEFIKRRHLSRGRPRKYELGSGNTSTTTSTTGDVAAAAAAEYKERSSNFSGRNSPGHTIVASPLPDTQSRKGTRGAKKKASLKPQASHHLRHPNDRQQQREEKQPQQQQRYPGESIYYNNCDNMVLPPFATTAGLSKALPIHSYAFHHNPNDRYLNPNQGPDFDFSMALYQDVTGIMDC